MEIYNKLPESVQFYINKSHFSHNVLPSLIQKQKSKVPLCENCCYHGFPCLNCAEYKFCGKLGPGFCSGKRIMFTDDDDETSWFNMLLYMLNHECYNLEIRTLY